MATDILKFTQEQTATFLKEVSERSGQNLQACYQCRRCAAGCPVADDTGVTPDRLIRMIVMGDRDQASNNLLVWKCVSCYTCGTRCPNNIHTARINETLKQMAKEKSLQPLDVKIAAFHGAFMKSASHFGRINEMEFMGLYEIKASGEEMKRGGLSAVIAEMMAQAKLGIEMMKRKRMHFGFSRIKGMDEIKRLFNRAGKK
ncbi:MAG: 4Fe-4S dicluster domain-containing protein [Nitrospirae bacterium]|nr:4Fe-4S dicluster domain-containing protein [Nitrospirota bacterium]